MQISCDTKRYCYAEIKILQFVVWEKFLIVRRIRMSSKNLSTATEF